MKEKLRGQRPVGSVLGRVLIADDNIPFRKSLRRLFEQAGFRVECAGTAGTSLDKALRVSFDVIVVDVHMPEEARQSVSPDAGIVVTQMLQRTGRTSEHAMVVVFTAFPNARDCFAAVQAGAFYLPKTVTGRSMGAELVEECRRSLRERPASKRDSKDTWLGKHFGDLHRKFHGQTVAIVDRSALDRKYISQGTVLGNRVVFSIKDDSDLRAKLTRVPQMRRALPVILDV